MSDAHDPQPVLSEAACVLARAKHGLIQMVDLDRVAEAANATKDGVADYKMFMAIFAMFVERKDAAYETLCKPSPSMDEVWHAHLLDTKSYNEMNALLLNGDGFLHHDPYSGKNHEVKLARRKFMAQVFKQVFGADPKEGWGRAESEEDYAKRLTSKKRRWPSDQSFQVFVKTLRGQTRSLMVDHETLVEDVKLMLQDAGEPPVDQQRLVFAGKQLEDGRTMRDYKVTYPSTLHLLQRLRGC